MGESERMKIMGIEITCEQYEQLHNSVLANYSEKEWNAKTETERKEFILQVLGAK